jgi:predicted Zn-dependent protease
MSRLARFLLAVLFILLPATARAESMQIIRDAEIEATLKTMCTPVFRQAGVSPDAVRFVLVQDDTLNAFVAGGQNIFINTGLLLKTKNAAEVIGVVAHETGHIALGHLFRAQEQMDNMSYQALLAGVLGIAAGIAAHSGQAGMAIAGAGQGMAINDMLSHTRTQEASADQAGTRFLAGANLPVTGFLSFMETMKDQELLPDAAQSPYVRTHPMTQERIDFLKSTADTREKSGRSGSVPANWDALQGRMRAKLLGYIEPDRALQDRSDSRDAQYARAIAWYRKGQMDRALSVLDPLIDVEPMNPYLYELKGQILFEAGRIAQSIAPYSRAANLAPHAGLIRIAYGHALLEAQGEPGQFLPEAIRQLEQAVETETHAPEAHYFLAMAYGRQGKEGLSRLHLAEKYAMENRMDLADREAHLAVRLLPERSPGRLRAEDIIAAAAARKKGNKDKARHGGDSDQSQDSKLGGGE